MSTLVVTSMRDEAVHCLEWIAYHLAIGVSHFLIYSNDCSDGTDTILDCLQEAGIVTHVPHTRRGEKTIQWQAFKAASKHEALTQYDWVCVLDSDEFMSLGAGLQTVDDLVAALPTGTDAVAMPWRLFGNNGHSTRPDLLTLEAYTMASPDDILLPLSYFMKTLFRPSAFRELGVHRPKNKADASANWVDGSGRPLSVEFAQKQGRINLFGLSTGRNLVEVNHYSIRSTEDFLCKRLRGLPNRETREIGVGYWAERNFNMVPVPRILDKLAQTKSTLETLLALPNVRDLSARGHAHHQTQFAKMMVDPANVHLMWQLTLAGDSRAPSREDYTAHAARVAAVNGYHNGR
ncbi:MAG: glycosyltransferase family 2 protein [Halocynthiibacter sp.]